MITCGCSKPTEEEVDTPDARLELSGTSESNEITADKTSIPIAFSTNQSWSASSNVNWISVTPNKGSSGDAAIVAMVEENTTTSDRTGKVTIKAGNISKDVSIKQRKKSGEPAGETITLRATNITSSSFTVSTTTSSTKSYLWDVIEKSMWDSYDGETIWNSYVQTYKEAGVLSSYIITGNDSFSYSNAKAGTEYVAFAAFCDKNGVKTGEFFTETFKTSSGSGPDPDPDPNPNTSYLPAGIFELGDGEDVYERGGVKYAMAKVYSILYGNDGRVSRFGKTDTHETLIESKPMGYSYAYDIRGFSLERSSSSSIYQYSLSPNYYISECKEHWYKNGKIVFKYDDNNHISMIRSSGGNNYTFYYTWENDCLTKIVCENVYQYETYKLTISFSYGNQSNPYYSLNFDPTFFMLKIMEHIDIIDGRASELEYLGWFGKNSKKLATSVTIQGDFDYSDTNNGPNIKSYSATYEVSGNELKKMTVVQKYADNSSQTKKYLFYNEKYK